MKKNISLINIPLVAFVVIFPFLVKAESGRGIKITVKDAVGNQVGIYEESHALVIGISEYTEGWPNLPGVKNDIKEVKKILEINGFNVISVEDLNRNELSRTYENFINKYGYKPNNRLLFYFAGHGHTEKLAYGEEMGYIVPKDAPNPYRNKTGFLSKAIDMQMVEVYAKRIQSKHALFIFDSCFSGSIFALSRAVPKNISYKTSEPVRQFITSGGPNEEVPDKSVFREQFISALNGEADFDKDGYVTGTELGEFLQKNVVNYSNASQHPQYGKIRNPRLDKGDFVFALKNESDTVLLEDIEAEKKRIELAKEKVKNERLKIEALKALQEERRKLEIEQKRLEEEKQKIASIPKTNEKQYISRLSNVEVKNILTDCPRSVEILSNGFRLGDGWCFYKIDYPVKTNDYSLEFDAKLESRSGYGIWFRGNYSDRVRSFGVQFDPGAGGLKFLKYPETESAFYFKRYHCDNNWHHWKLYGKGANVKVFLDGNVILDRNDIPSSGTDFGFRTWRGKVNVKNLKISID
jgi:hypothetical protein